ncbi:hypothetical protein [Psychrosphaera algicola]|uniref:Uncharacterized protein n=1 Tax=Psychrosphaera algicola TaxID=3023714 RepID=A0ABT5FJH4_9GAMM|nr:hypothetical protein [Psychrosphaera sp. G1-22]MDC2891350.1 hypothetical protein [Psychrosphaera sp. G1-22]
MKTLELQENIMENFVPLHDDLDSSHLLNRYGFWLAGWKREVSLSPFRRCLLSI